MRALSAETRARDLAVMAEETLDVLVVGGGITGAGVALDAVSRGLRVGLVEREDIASGTSGRSSRLIHGGPRYLQRAELGLVRESLRERAILMRLAPRRRRATGGYVYWDCRTDDARLTLEVVRAAASFGARVATRAEVVGLLGSGRVTGARVRDRLTGADLDVGARPRRPVPGSAPASASTWSSIAVICRSEAPSFSRGWRTGERCSWPSRGDRGCTSARPTPPTGDPSMTRLPMARTWPPCWRRSNRSSTSIMATS